MGLAILDKIQRYTEENKKMAKKWCHILYSELN
jgi:hypothetical protein